MFILVDDEDRENEGDLVIPAEKATPETINFMAKFGRGLICLAMTGERAAHLGLQLMPQKNNSRFSTAFTVSIEAREGVTTGISAHDRAHTIAVAIDEESDASAITTPGHVFPLVARDGGVLVRTGHTEAAVDLARLAGLHASGVICEIMDEDGSMARLPQLVAFAQFHGLKIGSIEQLIAYRRRFDKIVERVEEGDFTSDFGGAFRAIVYRNRISGTEHIALVKGDFADGAPVMVRMHALNVFSDLLYQAGTGKSGELQRAMRMIGEAGRGAAVLIREPLSLSTSGILGNRAPVGGSAGGPQGELRNYGVGAQILTDLGIRDMLLLTNSNRTVIGLDGYDLSISGRIPIPKTEK
ncbi:MAG: 3,4-dihydroxy-2-butanone-4-phosphate synthase [Rhodospirillaceae bacterium]|nr:3,4-dihydroxy-2-butanone-4-phosphate synthase [Rhodospirillaceae bacterium]MYH35726.1 3,4-dihydroxy-2-butanone-4-phosphate synthase [Rhodospirillaceae bacterium]